MTPEIAETTEVTTAAVRGTVPMAEIAAFFDRSFAALATSLERQGVPPTGPAYAYYFSEPGDTVEVEVGLPVERPIEADGDVVPSVLPAGRAARAVHEGAYDGLGESWRELLTWIESQGLAPAGGMWEVYLTEPSPEMDPASLRTELFWPLRE